MQPWCTRPGAWALVGSHLLADFYIGAVAATLPYFVLEAGYSYAQVAGLALAMTVVASVAQPGFGMLADRFRLRWAVPGTIAATATAMSLSATFATDYAVVWLLVALTGAASAGYHPPATMLVRALSPGSNTLMSVFAAAGNVGVALGPVAVVAVVGRHGLDATPLLLIPAVAGIALYAVVAGRDPVLRRGVPRPASAVRPPIATAPVPDPPGGAAVPPPDRGGSAGRRPGPDRWGLFGRLLIPMSAWQVAFTAPTAFIGVFVIDEFDAGTAAAAVPLTLLPAAGAAGTLLGGWLADRWGRLAVIRTGQAVAFAAAVAIAAAPAPWVVVVATGVLGAGAFMPFAPQLTLAHTYLPRRIGTASGLSVGLTAAVGGIVTAALGHVADLVGLRPVFVIVAAILAVGIVGAFTLRDPDRESHPERDASAPAVRPAVAGATR